MVGIVFLLTRFVTIILGSTPRTEFIHRRFTYATHFFSIVKKKGMYISVLIKSESKPVQNYIKKEIYHGDPKVLI